MTKLEQLRRAAGVSQRKLANAAIVARASISHLELQKYKPTPRCAAKICKGLSILLDRPINPWEVWPEHFSAPSEVLGHG